MLICYNAHLSIDVHCSRHLKKKKIIQPWIKIIQLALFFSFLLFYLTVLSLIITLNINSLKLSSLISSHLSETLKLTLTISPEIHHLSSSSSQTNAIPVEAWPIAFPAADRFRPTSRPKPQAVARFHRWSSIQALGFIIEAAAAFLVMGFSVDPSFGCFFFLPCCGLVVVVVVAVAEEKDSRFGFFFFFSLLWTGGGGGGGCGCGWW